MRACQRNRNDTCVVKTTTKSCLFHFMDQVRLISIKNEKIDFETKCLSLDFSIAFQSFNFI